MIANMFEERKYERIRKITLAEKVWASTNKVQSSWKMPAHRTVLVQIDNEILE